MLRGAAMEFTVREHIWTKGEIGTLREACGYTDMIFEMAVPGIRAGVSELHILGLMYNACKRIAADTKRFRLLNIDFAIIESGLRTAELHGRATEKPLENGDFLTIDFGVDFKGVSTDFTRTLVIGKASEKQRHIYTTVHSAIMAAEKAIKPGCTGQQADAYARDIIRNAGYGECFSHSLGHGFADMTAMESDGVSLSENARDLILKEGMVFTIEPGIYIEGFGGVRIEDTVLLTKSGVEPLFRYTKELQEI